MHKHRPPQAVFQGPHLLYAPARRILQLRSVCRRHTPVQAQAGELTAVISGTANTDGIGRACVREFLQAGYRVVGLDINPPQDEGDDEILSRFKSQYKMLETDVSEEESVRASVEEACEFLGGQITSLVNNAGIALSGMSEEPGQRVASFKKFISVNLVGMFIVSEACLPFMPDGQSSIVNISSIQATSSWPNTEGYASAKSGILGLTRAQAVSLDKKVRVNTVLPGWIVTPGSQARLTQDIHDWHLTGLPPSPPSPRPFF
ncbi:hypothetical protein WJX74_006354 [Apatococcus lobatus]|uniref:Uncharacterized protein n=1 Tax=Apatococcus lobatus TaxID=904363 RepID=A0AAW1SAM8_9CHLO